MDRIAAVYLRFLTLLKALSGVIIFCVFLLIVSDVLTRSVGLKPWLYSSVLAEYGLLWFTMLAAPWLARHKAHVFIDAITQLLPEATQRTLAKIVYAVCAGISLIVAGYAASLLISAYQSGEIDTRAVDMPQWTLYAPIPLCFLLVGVEFLRFLVGYDSMYGSRSDVRESA